VSKNQTRRLHGDDRDQKATEVVTVTNNALHGNYPLLEALLAAKRLALQGTYSYRDAAEIFDCSVRALQQRIRDGRLTARDLPGRKKFLPHDLEEFLRNSVKDPKQWDGGK